MSLNNEIKRVIDSYLNTRKLSDVAYGTVVSVAPLSVKVDNKPIHLGAEFFDVPQHLTDWTVEVEIAGTVNQMIVKNALQVGDRLLLLTKAGGQKYAVLDRLI